MIHFARKAWAVCVALGLQAGCTPVPTPPAPPSSYPPADCGAACARTAELACAWWVATCVQDCEVTNRELAALPGSPLLNTGCLTAATSCDAQLQCRGGQ